MIMTAICKDAPFAIVYIFYIVFQIGSILYYTLLKSYQTDILPKNVSAAGFAAINGLASLGGVTGPLIMGSLRQRTGSFVVPLFVLAALSFMATFLSLLLYFGKERHQLRQQRQNKQIAGIMKKNSNAHVFMSEIEEYTDTDIDIDTDADFIIQDDDLSF